MGLFSKLSYISRRRKLELFYQLIKPSAQSRILDIGAEVEPFGERSLQFIDSYPWKENIAAVNISEEHVTRIRDYYPEIDTRIGDACNLPWPEKYFDAVYSNAVIEHVGSFEDQKKMAAEVERVGKCWFITTPNRWYPFEFHMQLPFITWLPCHGYLWFGRLVSYDHVRQKYCFGAKRSDTRLLSTNDLRKCFPTSKIIKQRVTFMAETLVVVGGDL